MDVIIVLVAAGLALLGAFWGALRIASNVLAVLAGIVVGRWAGPPAAGMIAGLFHSPAAERIAATALVALVAAGLVMLAGRGLRRGVDSLHLGWLDRGIGLLIGGAAGLALVAALLGLAAFGGHTPTTPLAGRLSEIGQAALAVEKLSLGSAPVKPAATPHAPH
jgi:uncharacterized membrane protein required for colicin V production